jgi:hypothetical protein
MHKTKSRNHYYKFKVILHVLHITGSPENVKNIEILEKNLIKIMF